MFKSIFTFCSIAIVFVACNTSKSDKSDAVGKFGTVVVVADKSIQSLLKSTIDSTFSKDLIHYTGGEAFSEILRPDPEEFSKFFFNQKSIFVMVTNGTKDQLSELLEPFKDNEINQYINSESAELISKKDVFAKYQHVVYLFAKDAAQLKLKLSKCETQLTKLLLDFEIKDNHDKIYSKASRNDSLSKVMKSELGLCINVPDIFNLKEHQDGFWWFEQTVQTSEGEKVVALIAHAYPSNDSSDYSYTSIVTHRDSVVKYHIRGELKGTYMSTSESDQYPRRYIDKVTIGKNAGAKVRAWWKIDGMMMSGPYLRYIVKVPNSNKIFAFEGFTYTSNLDFKDKDLRLIESIALSVH